MITRFLITLTLFIASGPVASANTYPVLSRSGAFLSKGTGRWEGPSHLRTAIVHTRKLALTRAWSKAYDSCKLFADAFSIQSGLQAAPSYQAVQDTEALYDCKVGSTSFPGQYLETPGTYDSYDINCDAQAFFVCVLYKKSQ